MENILITGADGQLGSELRGLTKGDSGTNWLYTDVHELDITDAAAVEDYISAHGVTKIINCAAYNAVDQAETDTDAAIRLNVTGPMNLAEAAARHGIYLMHISTDFVFDGTKSSPYHESDRPAPLSEYGRTKLAGETAVKRSGCLSVIIRTSWLIVKVVYDQKGSPTYARDLAEAILHIIPQLDAVPRYGEVFHYADEGCCTKAEFAQKIMNLKHPDCDIEPVPTSEFPAPARRPAYSVLDKSLIKMVFGVKVPLWERSLSKAVRLF